MYFLISLLLALFLTIPTYGISLIVFFWVKDWCDKQAARAILNTALISLKKGTDDVEELYHINRGGIKKVFDAFSIGECREENVDGDRGITSYTGLIQHPMVKAPIILNVIYTARAGTKNTIFIKAELM
ncbi:hypothetical protein [Vibrio harveyi]|uniref:hypothetical protein n=1 Tax=Vibrio harveyi TaxID=669 RepID=UPI0018F18D9F|nr:hypothetical protein [Vibrio harveyi]